MNWNLICSIWNSYILRFRKIVSIKLVELFKLVGAGLSLVCCLVIQGSTGGFLLLRGFSDVILHPRGLRVSQYVVSVESSSLTHHKPYS